MTDGTPTPSEAAARRRPGRGIGCALWLFALLGTLGSLVYQDRTGPTYPLEGTLQTEAGPVRFLFIRSETIGADLGVMLLRPLPEGVQGRVRYRRYRSRDPWTVVGMEPGEFRYARRGRTRTVRAVGAALPSLKERAGKYEYYVEISASGGDYVSVTGSKPIYARYKASVPGWALMLHIAAIFASMFVAMRATLGALFGQPYRTLLWATVITLLLGGFVLGPLVQWYAFGVWWSGFPFGYDWTDNKVAVGLAFWLVALWANRGARRSRWSVIAAGVVTLAVYFIPHSIFGSEYDYISGSGHGTAG